jgi:formate dehydrogenase major subunit
MKGATYERLDGYRSLQWPVAEDGTDMPLLYKDGFPLPGGKARLVPVDWTPPVVVPEEFDLHLNNGRMLEHFHEGNLTARVPGIREKVPSTFVEVSPELARERGIEDGMLVRIVSPYGAVKMRAVVTDRVSGKELYIPMYSPKDEEAVNLLTSSESDTATHTPAFKEMNVRLEVLEFKGPSPIVKGNPRLGQPNPKPGVEVEKKWAREDYQPLVGKVR